MSVQALGDLLPVLVWSAGGALYLAHAVSMGSLVAFVALLVYVQGAIATASDAYRAWVSTRPAWHATTLWLGVDALDEAGEAEVATPLDGDLVLDEVTVRHDPERAPALDAITLHIRRGERVAVIGTSGAGKSTLLDLCAGLTHPTSGTVRWSGKSAREIGRASLRAAIAVAPQEAFLFATTLRENVRMGRPGASDDDVENACRRAGLSALLDRLPERLDTAIDERGQNLSGGERQRLAIARAFLREPSIVLLDEPTSALDVDTERALLPELDTLCEGRTAIVVTHRLALARRADRVIVLEHGKIVRDGPPDAVLDRDPDQRIDHSITPLESSVRSSEAR